MSDTAAPRARMILPRPLIIGGAILLASVVVGLFPALFAPFDPNAFDYGALLQAPSWAHPMGTDNFGRDVLSRVCLLYTSPSPRD